MLASPAVLRRARPVRVMLTSPTRRRHASRSATTEARPFCPVLCIGVVGLVRRDGSGYAAVCRRSSLRRPLGYGFGRGREHTTKEARVSQGASCCGVDSCPKSGSHFVCVCLLSGHLGRWWCASSMIRVSPRSLALLLLSAHRALHFPAAMSMTAGSLIYAVHRRAITDVCRGVRSP